jgi:ferredoxin-NADP reductase
MVNIYIICYSMYRMPTVPMSFSLILTKKEQVSADCYSFHFDRSGAVFDFAAGQYIRMILPHTNQDDRGTSRFFTIASSPTKQEYLTITTRVVRSSFKKTLHAIAIGQAVQFWGPLGTFTFPDKIIRPLIFIAGGIGITPFHSMLMYMYDKKIAKPATLFASFSTLEDLVYYNELTAISKKTTNISVVYTITKSNQSYTQWHGDRGGITKELIETHNRDVRESTIYLCGPKTIVEATAEVLYAMRVPREQIIIENFAGY